MCWYYSVIYVVFIACIYSFCCLIIPCYLVLIYCTCSFYIMISLYTLPLSIEYIFICLIYIIHQYYVTWLISTTICSFPSIEHISCSLIESECIFSHSVSAINYDRFNYCTIRSFSIIWTIFNFCFCRFSCFFIYSFQSYCIFFTSCFRWIFTVNIFYSCPICINCKWLTWKNSFYFNFPT